MASEGTRFTQFDAEHCVTFVATGGVPADGDYTVTLESRDDGFKSLDGVYVV